MPTRRPTTRDSISAPPALLHTTPNKVKRGDRELTYFGGSDYFRLAWDRRVRAAFKRAASDLGHNLSASRMTTGNHPLHLELEAALARFLALPCAVLTPNGYSAPLVAGQALKGVISHALIDEKAHACVKDGALLSGAKVTVFPHRDLPALKKYLGRRTEAAVAVFTDGLSAHDGSVAPLAAYLDLLPRDAWLVVDDAHGVGTLGDHGRGALEHTGISDHRIILTLTLSKAIGSYGGAVAGPAWLRDAIRERSHLYGGASPAGLPYVAAALRSLEILASEGSSLRGRLGANAALIRDVIGLPPSPGPTIALAPPTGASSKKLEASLLKAGIYPTLIRYPGGPSDQFFRFSISSAHSRQELDSLTRVLTEANLTALRPVLTARGE